MSDISPQTLTELTRYLENGCSIGKLLRMVFANSRKKLVSDLKMAKVEHGMVLKANTALAGRMKEVCKTLEYVRGQHRGAASEVQRLTELVSKKENEE